MGTITVSMSFVRLGGRTIAYGRGDRTDLEPPVVYTPPAVDLDGPLRQQIELLKAQNHNLEVEIAELKKAKASHKPTQVDNGLGPEFDFGRRVFECKIARPGVGYRNTPEFSNKNKDGTGPQAPDLVIADAMCQAPRARGSALSTRAGKVRCSSILHNSPNVKISLEEATRGFHQTSHSNLCDNRIIHFND